MEGVGLEPIAEEPSLPVTSKNHHIHPPALQQNEHGFESAAGIDKAVASRLMVNVKLVQKLKYLFKTE